MNAIVSGRIRTGVLAGTKALIEKTLDLGGPLQSKAALRALSAAPRRLDSPALLNALYALIECNQGGRANTDPELWSWTVRRQMNARNPSPERMLERAIVAETSEWVNQIPAASGLAPDCDERHINIDLARRSGPNRFEFVELKTGKFADTPVQAAFEIVRMGLLYCLARLNRSRLHLPKAQVLMKAERIDLKVLATAEVYAGCRLDWLAEELNRGLAEFSARRFGDELTLSFGFEAFPADFRWPEHRTGLRRTLEMRAPCRFATAPVPAPPATFGVRPEILLSAASPRHRVSA